MARSKGTWVAMLAALGVVLMVLLLTSPGSHPKPAQAQTTQDPLTMARASLVVDDGTHKIEVGSFNEFDGLTDSIKLPRAEGTAAHPEPLRIVLKRPAPANGDLAMSAWHRQATTQATGYRQNATLTFYTLEGRPSMKFHLHHAWPAAYHIGSVKSGSSHILYESVTLTASSLQRVPAQ